jgi:hypothetical protein
MPKIGPYRRHVTHPRYGYAPHVTGMNAPVSDRHGHWLYLGENIIPDTSVPADALKQRSAFPVRNYYDLDKVCVDCSRPFIFFALEQKYWYEDLGFPLDSKCIRCPECRKRDQQNVRLRARYDALQKKNRTWEESVEVADIALALVSTGAMKLRDFSKIRRFLNEVPETERHRARYTTLVSRLRSCDMKGK